MESVLNILWMLIALGALGVWRIHWSQDRREGRQNVLHEWTAIACALIFLFFAVSLTDDLHFDLAIFDECTGARRHSAIWTGGFPGTPGAKMQAVTAGVLPHVSKVNSLIFTAHLEARDPFFPAFTRSVSFLGRAPPVSIL
jgi:hypothetical protein